MIDISPEQLNTVKNILKEHMPEYEVWAFGSRVTWTAKDYSDLDLALVGEKKISICKLRQLEDAFQESDLPFRVDVLDLNMIDDEFKKLIKENYEVIKKPKVRFGNKMNDNRNTYKLKDIANIIMGQSPKGSTYNKCGNGVPLLNGPTDFGAVHPVPTTWTTIPTKLCQKGDLLFCVRGATTGRMNWADREYCLGRGVAAFRGKLSPLDTFYIYYYLRCKLSKLLSIASGSVFPNLSKSNFESFQINCPDIDTRKEIAEILCSLDDKIELNRRMNKTLEDMAKALFQSWFVNFDPVIDNALDEGGEIPDELQEKAARRLALGNRRPLQEEIRSLFPSRFVESELGWIPEGWEVNKLKDHLIIKGRIGWKGLKTSEYVEEGFVIVGGKEFYSNRINWKECPRITKERYEESPEIMLKKEDILMTKDGTIGKIAYIDDLPEMATVASGVFVIRNNSNLIPQRYIYLFFKSNLFDHIVDSRIEGSVVPHLYQRDIVEIKVVVPSIHIVAMFNNIIESLMKKIKENHYESIILTSLRDTLLPKLISGQIRVQDAERILETSVNSKR